MDDSEFRKFSRWYFRRRMDVNDIDAVLEERGERYGDFVDHAVITQFLKSRLWVHQRYPYLKPYQREALEMICHKIGRIVNGDPDHIDSWMDIAGYAQLVVRCIEKEKGEPR